MWRLREAQYIGGHQIRVTFTDGAVRVVDLSGHLDGEIFEPLKDPEYFRTFRFDLDLETIVWPNGADLAPEFLYAIGTLPASAAR